MFFDIETINSQFSEYCPETVFNNTFFFFTRYSKKWHSMSLYSEELVQKAECLLNTWEVVGSMPVFAGPWTTGPQQEIHNCPTIHEASFTKYALKSLNKMLVLDVIMLISTFQSIYCTFLYVCSNPHVSKFTVIKVILHETKAETWNLRIARFTTYSQRSKSSGWKGHQADCVPGEIIMDFYLSLLLSWPQIKVI